MAPPTAIRLSVSLVLGMLAAFVTYMHTLMDPVLRDFSLILTGTRAVLHGADPYSVVPGLAYPLPGLLTLAPWTLAPETVAGAAFMVLSASAFAWALMEHGYAPLVGFFSPGMLFAAQVGQFPPLFAGAYALAPLGIFLIVKPHVGLATFLARPTWWPVASAVVFTLTAFAIQPTWWSDWQASRTLSGAHLGMGGTGSFPYTAPLLLPGGMLVLAALTRWRRSEARLLVALACVPQSLLLYEIVPLALVPRGWRQATLYVLVSHAIWRWLLAQNPWPLRVEYVRASGSLYTLFLFLPLTAMVLRRPNEGVVPDWLECRITRWPAWLRGVRP